MKNLTLFLVLLLPLSVLSQNLKIDWQGCFGGPSTDYAHDIVLTDGGYLLAGRNFFNDTRGDATLTKIDLEGNLLWEKVYGGSKNDGIFRLLPTQDGNYYLIGGSASSDGDISFDPYTGDDLDFWIIKIDPAGNIIWDRIYGGTALDHIWDATLTSDGGVVALGWTGSNDGDISEYFGIYDTWMIKLNSEGDKVWDFTMGTASFDYANAIIETSDKGFLVSSSSENYGGGNIQCDAMSWHGDIALFKLDSLSNFEWQACYGASLNESCFDMIETDDGYILACYTRVDDGDAIGSGYHIGSIMGNPTSDIWLIKIDFSGNIIWQKCYGGYSDDVPARIFKTEDGGFLVFGNTGSNDGDVVGNHSSGPLLADIWVFKINSTGDLLWQQCFGGNGDEIIESGVIKLSDNHFIIATSIYGTNSGQIACQTNPDNYQMWVISVSDSTVGIVENPYSYEHLKVYPSPATDYIIFESAHINTGEIIVTDMYGKTMAIIKMDGKTVWGTANIKPGVYLYTLNDGVTVAKGKFVICK